MGDDTTYTQAIYFIYVTISTIGFGDFVIRFEDQNDYNRVVSVKCLPLLFVEREAKSE